MISQAFYNIQGTFSVSKKEFKGYIRKEIAFYEKLADMSNHCIKRINPDKLAKITRKYFPTRKEGIQELV